ncbi:hypothetical protein [Burkholderia pseudomallei]|nr:hypothetical protein [Burkholderia pseudomallei]
MTTSHRKIAAIVLVLAMSFVVAGCGLIGCGGSATNGGAFGGCQAGARF